MPLPASGSELHACGRERPLDHQSCRNSSRCCTHPAHMLPSIHFLTADSSLNVAIISALLKSKTGIPPTLNGNMKTPYPRAPWTLLHSAINSTMKKSQGALKHSGVIIPVQHRETVFDLSEAEIIATFRLLSAVKKWMGLSCCTGWVQHRLELRQDWWSRGLSRPHACDSQISTRAAGWQRHQNASEVRREQLVSMSKYEGTPNQGMQPTRNKPRAPDAWR